jgi:hypothetical protein
MRLINWDAYNWAANREIPRILRNPKSQYRVPDSSPLFYTLIMTDTTHTFPVYLFDIITTIIIIIMIRHQLGLNLLKPSGNFTYHQV